MSTLVLSVGAVVALTSVVVVVAFLVARAGSAVLSPRRRKQVFVAVILIMSLNCVLHLFTGQPWIGVLYGAAAIGYLVIGRQPGSSATEPG